MKGFWHQPAQQLASKAKYDTCVYPPEGWGRCMSISLYPTR